MTIQFNIDVIIIFALIAIGFFVGVFLLFSNQNKTANKYLGTLLLIFSLWLCDTFFRVSGIYSQDPDFYFLPIYASLAFGPLIYFYTKALTTPNFVFKRLDYIHFIPGALQVLFYLNLSMRDYAYRRDFWIEVHEPITFDLEFILSFISIIIYLILGMRQLRQYKSQIENYYSDLSKITLNRLRIIYILLSIIAAFWLIDAISRILLGNYPITPLSSLSMGIAMVFLAVFGILQEDLRNVNRSVANAEDGHYNQEKDPIQEALVVSITSTMQEKQLFLRNELTLSEFSKELNLPQRLVSRHINSGLGLSFIDFVNQFRVERVKNLLDEGNSNHLSLFGIALESGFNSKSTFNRIFKKATGKSPSEYAKEVQNAN